MLDMTEALQPSELFALRWRSFDDMDTLSITETVYKGEIRLFGKTDGSLTDVHLPAGLAEELRLWKRETLKASVITLNPAIRDRVKSGHSEWAEDVIVLPCSGVDLQGESTALMLRPFGSVLVL
jgi:integrase